MKFSKIAIPALFIIHAQLSYSQTNETDTTQNKTVSLGEVVVSANNTEETKKTVAQQVQVISTKEIAALQAQSTADLIANSGNVFMQKSQQGGGSPSIRGFEANRILLVIDGVRMNNLIYRGGHLQNIVTSDNNSLDRVEVLFGPASTVYGSDALGGVIHLYTKKPLLASDDKKTNMNGAVFFRYGTVNNESTTHFDLNLGAQKFASFTSFTNSMFGDLQGGKNQNPFYTKAYGERPYYVETINGKDSLMKNSNPYLQVGSGYNQYDLVQKLLYQQSEHLSHSLNLQYSNSGDVPRYDRLTDPNGTGLNSAEWYYGPQTRLLTAYDMNRRNLDRKFQNIHFGVNYQAIEESRHDRNFGSKFKNHRVENVGVIGANLDFQRTTKSHRLRFGADMQLNNVKSTASREDIVADTSGKLDTRYPDGVNRMNTFAAYFSHTWTITEVLILTDGIRVGYSSLHSTLIDTAVLFNLPYTTIDQRSPVYSGSVGLIHSPSDDLKFSLMLSTGFRVPNVDDMSKIFASAPGIVIVPNVNLKPETTVNHELGLTKIFNQKTRCESYLFFTQFNNAIVTDKATFKGSDSILYEGKMSQVYSNQNKGEAYLYGFSSNLVSQVSNNFKMAMAINYIYGRIKTDSMDSPLDHIPPFMGRFQLSYNHKKFSSNFFVNYNGWKRMKDYNLGGEDNQQYATPDGMPAWFTVNIRFAYQLHKLVVLQTGVDNIFDTQYRTFASGINAPGRNVFFTLRGNF